MIKLERTSVTNFDNAMRGARNPMNSWGRYDSYYDEDGNFVFGPNDLSLAKRLCKAGTDHRKFIRMIFVTVDVTAPMYWWKEYDTYKVGTVANSTSTMHKIASKPFELADFSVDHMDQRGLDAMEKVIRDERDMEQELEQKIRWEKVRRYIEAMPEGREREILVLRYGLDNQKPLTQREVAQRLNISRSYVSRIEKSVLTAIRRAVQPEENGKKQRSRSTIK